ncbi:MAG: 16S rRNA (adenine(1518)-N(6)/adenine(1519)-N(6))-dimethyltransferase RsmA [Euryarchaeota archaeon]|nr:16S rRNA (adenine(1518)-N(6)/adenine(1519)-N(6))-dimethyltransferase RsmA [Euryarchaeota archaeon]
MDVKTTLIERGIRATRSLGQYFLIDDGVATRMVEFAGVERGDVVLEIGAGVGSVTGKLVRRAKKVYAVEKDKELCELLREQYGTKTSKTEVIEGDFMKLELPDFDKVVASIPFSLSSAITYKLLLHPAGFGLAVLLYQKEFAQKLVAKPRSKSYGRLSVIAQALAEIEILEIVHRDAFYPSAPVKGAIVRLKERKQNEKLVEDKKKFFGFVTEAFDQRRKKMRSIFKNRLSGGLTFVELDKRPEELKPKEFAKLAQECL